MGWQILEGWLKDRAYHSWVDPKDFKKKEEWEWAELNLYHNAQVAKQLLEDMNSLIGQAEYLRKKERGEIEPNKFKSFWQNIVKKKGG